MGDRVRVQFSVRDIYLGMWPVTQVNSTWSSFRGRRNKNQPKGVTVKLCDPLLHTDRIW